MYTYLVNSEYPNQTTQYAAPDKGLRCFDGVIHLPVHCIIRGQIGVMPINYSFKKSNESSDLRCDGVNKCLGIRGLEMLATLF